jgi:alpha-L-rhamnosidase
VRTNLGTSDWSDWSWWETGLLSPGEWSARWIEPHEADTAAPGERPAHLMRMQFSLETIGRARVYATAHGIYELYLNGERVGDNELTPGSTSYRHRLHVQTYDVDDVVHPGDNELWAVVSDGWFRGQNGNNRVADIFGRAVALLAQLEVEGDVVAATGPDWMSAVGAISRADLIVGETLDQRIRAGDLSWEAVQTVDHDSSVLCSSPAPPVRRIEQLRPVSVHAIGPDRHVVDLGQNINGWIRLADTGPANSHIRLVHGEALDADGDVTLDHLRPVEYPSMDHLDAGQVDVVVSDGTRRVFEPRHTTHGFRYVRVEGHPGPLDADDVAGVVVHTDLRRTGWFACSNPDLNRLHEAAVWSFRGNACDIPTDCPQRERAGWTGDWQIFAPTAAFIYDVAGFSTKWLRDLAADQRSDGAVRNFAPDPAPEGADDHFVKTFLEGSAGWGDAAVLVPWAMWLAYGDRGLLENQWESMTQWIGFVERSAADKRHASRVERSPEPAPHEHYLWDTGFHWGEWLEPDVDEADFFANIPKHDFAIIASAFYAHSAALLARIAAVLGRPSDAGRFRDLAARARDAWRHEFLTDDGLVLTARQADCVRALAFGLVDDTERAAVAAQLVSLVRAAGTHLNTGFLATPDLLLVLAEHGNIDLAYEVLLQRTPPSWLTMVDRGATTIWEHWEGIDAAGEPHASLNHYSKGAVITFLHRNVAGIRVVEDGPGYRRFVLQPQPGGGLTWASAAHESPYGRIESSWTLVNDELHLEVIVPPGTSAMVVLPSGERAEIGPGRARFRCEVTKSRATPTN